MDAESPEPVTVVLVHGAFADASSWAAVARTLRSWGVPVTAVANPLRGLTADGEYLAAVLAGIEGEVVLAGHSYGGSVATYAGSKAENVGALVLVASFGLAQGTSSFGSVESFPPAGLHTALRTGAGAGAGTGAGTDTGTGTSVETEFLLAPETFHPVFCADLPAERAAVLAVSQRPGTALAFHQPLAVEPAWAKVPSWFVIAGADRLVHPDSQRAAAERVGAVTVEIAGGSHAIVLSHADLVAAVISDAVRSAAGN